MEYAVNESIFVRKEKQGDEDIYFIYVGDRDEMYKLNESSFDCFALIQNGLPFESVCNDLGKKYTKTSAEVIKETVQKTIDNFISAGIIIAKN